MRQPLPERSMKPAGTGGALYEETCGWLDRLQLAPVATSTIAAKASEGARTMRLPS
jgi:hypothetical protein